MQPNSSKGFTAVVHGGYGQSGASVLGPEHLLRESLMYHFVPRAGSTTDAAATIVTNANSAIVLAEQDKSFFSNNNGTQATTTNAFFYRTNQIQGKDAIVPVGTTSVLGLTNPVYLPGTFTLYAVTNITSGSKAVFTGAQSGTGFIDITSSATVTVSSDVGTTTFAQYTGVYNTPAFIRVRREANNNVFVAATGQAETKLGLLSGTITFNQAFAATDGTLYNPVTNVFAEIWLSNTDTVNNVGSQDKYLLQYLAQQYPGVSFPQ